MNTTPMQSATDPGLIRRQLIFSAQNKARTALEDTRSQAWRNGARMDGPNGTAWEEAAAHKVSDAIADLVALALHVEDDQ